ncbi:Z1 domain-containing protein [Metabacillus indicus]|uniref:Z1 domain-containing protein n=1 Tax=Metabacillus indicus TaxID=246786 RepID=UPI00068D3306|nr:Z1 domain-containing protein [Metabacillus indicus]
MINISLPNFDKCREWIVNARKKDNSWELIRMALKKDEVGLQKFLESQKENNFWPDALNVENWLKLVDSEKNAEERSLEVSIKDRKAFLIDDNQDSEVTVPTDSRSSWQLYRKHLIDTGFHSDSVNEIESATIGVLRRLNIDSANAEPVKGLVIGHVQSGKTANMAALMAMAADWGWNFFVVLSGTIENLRKQTQSRLFNDLNRPGNINWSGLEHLSKRTSMGQRAQDLHFEETSIMRYFTVCLKNAGRLKNLIEWVQQDSNKHRQMKVIVIDDEADQASINTADINKKERARINNLIVNLVEGKKPNSNPCETKVKSMNYISYTATPYANFLNESAPESLYPRNFIRTLQPSNEYFGPRQIFGIEGTEDSDGINIVRTISESDLDEIKLLHNGEAVSIPGSLKDSICWFLCSAAAMRYLGHRKPISMLVHTSQKQSHHKEVSEAIRNWIDAIDRNELMDKCKKIWNEEKKELSLESFREAYPEYGRPDEEINSYPEFNSIVSNIEVLLEEVTHIPLGEDGSFSYKSHIHLCVDNCANNGVNEEGMFVRLAYPDPEQRPYPSPAPAFIIVGGSTLSRGLTIEGLVSTYFLRSTLQADSLMQMGRWFGYRRGYELFPRIWMTNDTVEKFRFLSQLEMELREDLCRFEVAGGNPLEVGPKIKNTPNAAWLKITAKNRMQSANEIEMDFTGVSSQTIFFENNIDKLKQNIELTDNFINSLGKPEKSRLNALVWRNVKFGGVLKEYLCTFNFHQRSRVFNEIDAFSEWIMKVSSEEELDDWNIIVAGNETSKDTWVLNAGSVGKVNRSRKKTNKPDEDVINIGALRAPTDLLADVRENLLSPSSQEKLKKSISTVEVDEIRMESGLEKTPQLIIYRISKDSKARQSQEQRVDLNAVEDIIGLCIFIPGVRKRNGFAKVLTIKIDPKAIKQEENWSDEE